MVDFKPEFFYMVARGREEGYSDEELAEANDLTIKDMRLRMKMELDAFNAMNRYSILTQYQMFASIFDENDPEAVTRTAVRCGYPESTTLFTLNKIRELYHINVDKNDIEEEMLAIDGHIEHLEEWVHNIDLVVMAIAKKVGVEPSEILEKAEEDELYAIMRSMNNSATE